MSTQILAIPRCDVSVREGTALDIPFIDELQKAHRKQVGFMSRGQLEGKLKASEVLIAEEPPPQPSPGVPGAGGRAVGYVIGTDRYFKHDDVGIIYHLNVAPGRQRGFVGATLLKAMFDRAAYGCKLFSCWCAQDIEANKFWEAMGFVPLAYRAGSEKKIKGGRVHIFWQKRIREGDNETPWWFPSQTTGGAMNEPRLVFPIPPGTHWSDAKPVILPGAAKPQAALESPLTVSQSKREGKPIPKPKPQAVSRGAMLFFTPPPKPKAEKKKPEKKPKRKNDPRLVAAARELKDRWLEHVNSGQLVIEGAGKYDVSRVLPAPAALPQRRAEMPLLPAA